MLEQIDHINIVVADIESMIGFYRDALGFRLTKRVTIGGAWVETVVGLPNVKAEVVYLEASAGARVELMQYISPESFRPSCICEPNAQGIRHLAFRAKDLDKMVESLQQRGVRFTSEVQQVPDSQVTYAGGVRKRIVYFQDPENNLLELCEYA